MLRLLVIIFITFSAININCQDRTVPLLIQRTLPCVVLIQTESSLGSGVIVSTEGFILTNWHVVENAQSSNSGIFVQTHSKDRVQAQIVDYDDDLDICLLKTSMLTNDDEIKVVNPDSLLIGEDVVCIGNPFGTTEYVTKGIISKYNTPYVFTSASINPGNSGGALINMKGELVGIPTMTLQNAQNFNIALCPRTILYFLKRNQIGR